MCIRDRLSGRAGRTGKPATVYFQTYNIKSNVVSQITNANPDIFLEKELILRKKNNLPPFERFISIILSGKSEKKIETFAYKLKDKLEKNLNAHVGGIYSSDTFYDGRPDLTAMLEKHGVLAVEMETAELYNLALRYKRRALSILTISDHLQTGKALSSKDRESSFSDMVEIALEAAFPKIKKMRRNVDD